MFKNHTDVIGFIGSDPETRQLENGTFLTSFFLPTRTSWKNDSGAYDSRTEWHRIVVWGKLAHFAGTLRKGGHTEIEGNSVVRPIKRKSRMPIRRPLSRSTRTVDTIPGCLSLANYPGPT
jgi:single stranded DNA-binding protein